MATGFNSRAMAQASRAMGAAVRDTALAPATKSRYVSAWRQWSAWCRRFHRSRWLTGPERTQTAQLTEFAGFAVRFGFNRRRKGNSGSTVLTKLAGIQWFHRQRGIHVHLDRSLSRGLRRFSGPQRQLQPVTTAILRQVYRSLHLRDPHQRLLWGLMLLAYFFLLRGSEYTRSSGAVKPYVLKLGEIRLTESSVTLRLSGSKSDQLGRGAVRQLRASGHAVLCPIQAAKHVLGAHRTWQHPTSRPASNTPTRWITSQEVGRHLKKAARSLGLDPTHYASHSLRIGGATALVCSGASEFGTMFLGRWRSRAFDVYPAARPRLTQDFASLMAQDSRRT